MKASRGVGRPRLKQKSIEATLLCFTLCLGVKALMDRFFLGPKQETNFDYDIDIDVLFF